jgi:hypothetical protein
VTLTPVEVALKALTLALKDAVAALVLLLIKEVEDRQIMSVWRRILPPHQVYSRTVCG